MWKELAEYPGYSINEFGVVFNMNSKRILMPTVAKHGYKVVSLKHPDTGWCTRLIHRLVAQAFIPNTEDKPTVDHIDRDTQNNHVDNLRWATQAEQVRNRGSNVRLYALDTSTMEVVHSFEYMTAAVDWLISTGRNKKNGRTAAKNTLQVGIMNCIRQPKLYPKAYGYIWKKEE